MTMPIFTWNGMISSSMHLTHFSRWPGRTWYCRSSKIMRASRDQSLQRVHHRPALESVYDRVPVIRNLVALSPPTLPDTPPIEYVEAAAAAGYDAVGLRLARSPLFPYYPVVGNAPLIRELKLVLASSGLTVRDILGFYLPPATDLATFGRMSPNQRRLPGDGTLPLRHILDALPAGLPLSVEIPMPQTAQLSAREWARATADSTRRFLDGYYRAKQETR